MQAFDEHLAAEVKQADGAEVRAATAEVCMQCLLRGDVPHPAQTHSQQNLLPLQGYDLVFYGDR